MYSRNDPKWVQAESVEQVTPGYVNVVEYGETFRMCRVEWSNPFFDKSKSDVLVQNSRGDWLRVWFYDSQLTQRQPDGGDAPASEKVDPL